MLLMAPPGVLYRRCTHGRLAGKQGSGAAPSPTGGVVRFCCARVQLQVDAAGQRRAGHAQLQARTSRGRTRGVSGVSIRHWEAPHAVLHRGAGPQALQRVRKPCNPNATGWSSRRKERGPKEYAGSDLGLAIRLWKEVLSATREEEHAVSTTDAGPVQPNV